MRSVPETLARLRQTIARPGPGDDRPRVPLGHAGADAALMGGLRTGALHEVYAAEPGDGTAAAGFASAMAARLSAGWLFWIRQDFSALEHGEIHASGLCELGLDPARVLMLKVADIADALKAAGDALACCGLSTTIIEVLGESKLLDLTASRRLALAAGEKGVTAIVLRMNAEPQPSAAETRWIVRAGVSPPVEEWGAPVFDAGLARNRHGMCGQWVMEWCGDDRIFREPAYSGTVFAAPFDRPDRASPAWLRRAG